MEKKILIADSDLRSLRYLSHFIKKQAFKVFKATEGIRALDLARIHKPDIILCNTHLKGISGIQLCRELKKNIFTRYIPVVFISDSNDELEPINAIGAGAMQFISKNAGSSVIFEVVTEVLCNLEISTE